MSFYSDTIAPDLIGFGKTVLYPLLYGVSTAAALKFWETFSKKTNIYSISLNAEKNGKIQELLAEIRVTFKADRAYLTRYHNGDTFLEGSEQLKKTRTNESTNHGISSEAKNWVAIHISLLSDEMKIVIDPEVKIIPIDFLQDTTFKRMLLRQGVEYFVRCSISANGKIVGFIGLDYCDSQLPKVDNIQSLRAYAGTMEQIISNYK